MKKMVNCEFCDELAAFKTSRIGKLYPELNSRVLIKTKNFSVIPTIGQLLSPMLMIITNDHYDRFSEIDEFPSYEFDTVVDEIQNRINAPVILFEHGAKCTTGKACGVYHAHIHILPLISDFNPESLIGSGYHSFNNITDSFKFLAQTENYLLYRDNLGGFFCSTVEKSLNKEIFSSQYFRKWLTKNYVPDKDWNWNNYNFKEELPFVF